MKTRKLILATACSLCCGGAAAAPDDDKLTTFNPVEHAVISETIAPDARSAGMGVAPTPTSTHSTGTPPSTPSASAAPAWH